MGKIDLAQVTLMMFTSSFEDGTAFVKGRFTLSVQSCYSLHKGDENLSPNLSST